MGGAMGCTGGRDALDVELVGPAGQGEGVERRPSADVVLVGRRHEGPRCGQGSSEAGLGTPAAW
ncbi:hypothetical protein VR45_26675, partial [Streptomyces sp. NRRL S-495]